jgi:uncharacterized alkaline shock family protein YloU
MDEEVSVIQEQKGTITFANEVLATIAGIAASDIPGVAGMCGGLKDGIVEMLGRKNLSRGVKITLNENSVTVDIQIIVDYGVSVPEVCEKIQDSVINALDMMTGLSVYAVNIAIQGVKFKEIAEPAMEPEEI